MNKIVLMLTRARDVHAQVVGKRITDLGGEPVILDTSRFPTEIAITTRQGIAAQNVQTLLKFDGRTIRDDDIAGVWFRRPGKFRPPDNLLFKDDCDFVGAESSQAFEGWLNLLGDKVINTPHREQAANNKIMQLSCAISAGLQVPQTLTSNDCGEVQAFAREAATVFKPFTQPGPIIIPTRHFDDEHAMYAHQIRNAPHIYQEEVKKVADLRVNVIDDDIFATRIDSAYDDTPLDWRLDRNHRHRPHTLPTPVAKAIRRFMKDLGLRFGALDFGLCADGAHVFFEVNPSGQWLFCEIETGAPLSEAVASALLRGGQVEHALPRSASTNGAKPLSGPQNPRL